MENKSFLSVRVLSHFAVDMTELFSYKLLVAILNLFHPYIESTTMLSDNDNIPNFT